MKKFTNVVTIIAILVIIALIGTLCYGYYKKITMEVKNPIVTMNIKDYGTVKIELYPEMAPQTVSNFVALAKHGFYDGLSFHRVVKGFMIQGGDPNGDGTGSPKLSDLGISVQTKDENGNVVDSSLPEDREYCIKGEFISNEVKNTLKHEEGTVSMARSDYTSTSPTLTKESYNSAGSQFFIMTEKNANLDGYYAPFGKVIEGMDIIHNIENTELKPAEKEGDEASTPVNKPIIESVSVETYGVDYGLPDTLETWNYNDWVYKTYGINLNSMGNQSTSNISAGDGTSSSENSSDTSNQDTTAENTSSESTGE